MKDLKGTPRTLAIIGSVMTLSVPVLYLIGAAYNQGYLNAYGVSTEFFPRSFEDHMLYGFGVVMNIALISFEALQNEVRFFFFIGLGVASVMFLISQVAQRYSLTIEKKVKVVAQHNLFKPLCVSALVGFGTALLPLLVAVVAGIVIIVPYGAYLNGYHVAENEIKAAQMQSCDSAAATAARCIRLVGKQQPELLGRFVAKSLTHVAIYSNNRTVISLIKDQQVVAELPPVKSGKPSPAKAAQGT